MRQLILGTCYISAAEEGAQNYGSAIVKMWAELATKLNPTTDIVLVDSASPVNIYDAIGGVLRDLPNLRIHQLGDNVGHLNTTGRDGWGRAFSVGVAWAIERGYSHIAYMDADIIFTRPVGPILEKMQSAGVKAACPMDTTYNILENGLMFLDLDYVKKSRLIERYDWQSRRRTDDPAGIPEVVFERLLEDVLFTLPLRGLRDDSNRVTVNNIEHLFPYGIDYLTHVRDFRVYEKFLQMKGITL